MQDNLKEKIMSVTHLLTAFGLAGAAGLNAYIPLLAVAVLDKLGWINLGEQFDVLSSWPVIGLIVVLLVVEFGVDKIPGADHVNDILQTFVRPAAGALLFASQTNAVEYINPTLAIMAGLFVALGVHGTKTATRPMVNMTTMGIGGPIVSVIEDLSSTVLSIMALLAPILVIPMMLLGVLVVVYLVRMQRKLRTKLRGKQQGTEHQTHPLPQQT